MFVASMLRSEHRFEHLCENSDIIIIQNQIITVIQ